MDPGGGTVGGEPGRDVAQRAGAGVAVEDEEGVRALVRGGGLPYGGAVGARPAGTERTVVEPPGQLPRPRGGLVPVVREQQPAVLAVRRAQVRQPAEPAPVAAPVREGAGPVGADQYDLQLRRGVQRGELGDD
ncbi:hypothetical protein GCM10020254_51990 [Streptomyces goshikiensis]